MTCHVANAFWRAGKAPRRQSVLNYIWISDEAFSQQLYMFTHGMTENTIPILFSLYLCLSLALSCFFFVYNLWMKWLFGSINNWCWPAASTGMRMENGWGNWRIARLYAVDSSLLISLVRFLSHIGSAWPCCFAVATKWSRRTWRKKGFVLHYLSIIPASL